MGVNLLYTLKNTDSVGCMNNVIPHVQIGQAIYLLGIFGKLSFLLLGQVVLTLSIDIEIVAAVLHSEGESTPHNMNFTEGEKLILF